MNDTLNLFDSKRFIFALVRLKAPASLIEAIPGKNMDVWNGAVSGHPPWVSLQSLSSSHTVKLFAVDANSSKACRHIFVGSVQTTVLWQGPEQFVDVASGFATIKESNSVVAAAPSLWPPAGRKGLRPDLYLGLAPQAGIYRPFGAGSVSLRTSCVCPPIA